MYFSFFFSIVLFCFSFLEWDPLKSCISMCLGILSMSCYICLGVHVWYSYFIILIFLSGVFSLLTYFCSLSNFSSYNNYYYFFYFFVFFYLIFFLLFDYDFFSFYLDFNFLCIYYDYNYYYIFWVILILLLLLNLISMSLSGMDCFMRGV